MDFLFSTRGSLSDVLELQKRSLLQSISTLDCGVFNGSVELYIKTFETKHRIQELGLDWDSLEHDFVGIPRQGRTKVVNEHGALYKVKLVSGHSNFFEYTPSSFSTSRPIGEINSGKLSFIATSGQMGGELTSETVAILQSEARKNKELINKYVDWINADIAKFNLIFQTEIPDAISKKYQYCKDKSDLRNGLRI